MAPIATLVVAIRFKIVQELLPIARVIFIQRSSPRSLYSEPSPVSIHHAPHPRERQAMITKRLAVARRNHVDRVWMRVHNVVSNIASFVFTNRWKTAETLSPKILSFPARRCFNRFPVVIDLKQLNSFAQRISQ